MRGENKTHEEQNVYLHGSNIALAASWAGVWLVVAECMLYEQLGRGCAAAHAVCGLAGVGLLLQLHACCVVMRQGCRCCFITLTTVAVAAIIMCRAAWMHVMHHKHALLRWGLCMTHHHCFEVGCATCSR